jgi:hypothetical protein
MKKQLAFALALVAGQIASLSHPAFAGAWTLKKHHWQTFNATTLSMATTIFASHGHAATPTKFHKYLVQNTVEYGLTNGITLFATPDLVTVSSQTGATTPTSARGSSVEAGARVLLFAHVGQLSFQSSYKAAGPFDLSNSVNHDPAQQVELRLLYGTNFKFLGDDGFADIQTGERWISRHRPNETPIDLTAGLWFRRDTMVMAQSFNIVSGGDGQPPFTYYRSHKLELSLVERLSRHWLLQVGGFVSPAGQNALDEKGLSVVLWTQR